MKTVCSTAVILLALGGAAHVRGQDKEAAPQARVKVCGTISSLGISVTKGVKEGKEINEKVTLVVAKLADNAELHIQALRLIGGDELADLLKRGYEKGVVAEGTLKLEGKKLILTGEPRGRDDASIDKDCAKGTAIVEGEAARGRYKHGKGGESSLAIKNGAAVIVVAGNFSKEQAELQGVIRVTGKLSVDEKGTVLVTADKVEAVTKK